MWALQFITLLIHRFTRCSQITHVPISKTVPELRRRVLIPPPLPGCGHPLHCLGSTRASAVCLLLDGLQKLFGWSGTFIPAGWKLGWYHFGKLVDCSYYAEMQGTASCRWYLLQRGSSFSCPLPPVHALLWHKGTFKKSNYKKYFPIDKNKWKDRVLC